MLFEYGGSWETHFSFVEFAYNTYHSSIDMATYRMLYGKKCRTPTCWLKHNKKQFTSLEIVQITKDKVRIAHDHLWVAQERKNKYPDTKHRP